MASGERPYPETEARRHHFVPAFLLAEFAAPRTRTGWLYQLDTRTGKPQKTTPDSACFVAHLYAQRTDEDERDNRLEAFFSIVEKHAKPALKRLVADPLGLSHEDRQTVATFLALQFSRTPVALGHLMNTAQMLSDAMMSVHLEDALAYRRMYREVIEDAATDEEIEESRYDLRQRFASGGMKLSDPRAQAFDLMLSTADDVAEAIAGLSWLVLEAEEGEFVTSDRALAMHDPSPKFPWSGHAWRSSADAETCIALTPKHCLLIEDGPARTGQGTATAAGVMQLNLRTYGWADRFIYGTSQAVVSNVRQAAKRMPAQVIRPKVPKQVILREADPSDTTVGTEHVKRGWPRGLWEKDEKGRPQFLAYEVLDPVDPKATNAARAGAITGRAVIERAIAEGKATMDHLGEHGKGRPS